MPVVGDMRRGEQANARLAFEPTHQGDAMNRSLPVRPWSSSASSSSSLFRPGHRAMALALGGLLVLGSLPAAAQEPLPEELLVPPPTVVVPAPHVVVPAPHVVVPAAPVVVAPPAAPTPVPSLDGFYTIGDTAHANAFSFSVRRGPIGRIAGHSTDVIGHLRISQGTVSGEVRIPVLSVRTGRERRDRRFVSPGWLDANRHPYITFRFFRSPLPAALAEGHTVPLFVHGMLTIRGVSRPASMALAASYLPPVDQPGPAAAQGQLQIQGDFTVLLKEFGIRRRLLPFPLALLPPALIFARLGREAQVHLDLVGSKRS
jgi:polyisoprenoid-binding protein YceI